MKKERNVKRSKAKKNDMQNKLAMKGITFVVCVLLAVLLIQGVSLQGDVRANEERMKALEREYEEEQKRTEEIEELEIYMQSDEYMEKYAKDKIGLIKENEIIFKENK